MKKSFYLSGLLVFCFILCSAIVKAAIPAIGTNPDNATVCSGSQAKFIIAATGTAPITFTWLVSSERRNYMVISRSGRSLYRKYK